MTYSVRLAAPMASVFVNGSVLHWSSQGCVTFLWACSEAQRFILGTGDTSLLYGHFFLLSAVLSYSFFFFYVNRLPAFLPSHSSQTFTEGALKPSTKSIELFGKQGAHIISH